MNAVTTTTITPAAPGSSAVAGLRPGYCLLGALVATVIAVGSLVVAAADPSPVEIVRPVLVALWAVAGVLLGLRRQRDRLAPIVIAGSIVASVGTLAAAMLAHRSLERRCRVAVGPRRAAVRGVAAGGRLAPASRSRRRSVGHCGPTQHGDRRLHRWRRHRPGAARRPRTRRHVAARPVLADGGLGVGITAAHRRYVEAGAVDRRRMQWIGWGMAVAAEAGLVVVALRLLTDWPDHPAAVALALTGLVPARAHRRHVAEDGRPRRPRC